MSPTDPPAPEIAVEAVFALDVRAGTVVRAEPFPEARKPAYRLWIDFGPGVGVKRSSAQITERYRLDALVGRKVLGVVNLPPRQVGPFRSEALTLGFTGPDGAVVLASVDGDVPDGARLH